MIYGFYDKLLKKLNVKNYSRVSEELCHTNYDFYKKYMEKSENISFTQIGGSKEKYIYDNEKFIVDKIEENDRITINISKYKSEDSHVLVFIPKDENFIYLENITNQDKNVKIGMPKTKIGTLLMRMVLDFSMNILKPKYKCKYIQLKDNSYYWCDKIKKKIEFDNLYMLTKGNTWYGKYNFIPFNPDKKDVDIENYVNYKTNQKIINIIKIKHIDLYKYISKAFIELKINDSSKLKILEKLLKKRENDSIQEFLNIFLKDYDKMCDIFSYIYKDIMMELKMTNLHGITYYLPL
jgi:hypothetical protein